MEDNKNMEVTEVKESKIKAGAAKVGGFCKKHWKKVAGIGALAIAGVAGYALGISKDGGSDDSEDYEFVVDDTPTEEVGEEE